MQSPVHYQVEKPSNGLAIAAFIIALFLLILVIVGIIIYFVWFGTWTNKFQYRVQAISSAPVTISDPGNKIIDYSATSGTTATITVNNDTAPQTGMTMYIVNSGVAGLDVTLSGNVTRDITTFNLPLHTSATFYFSSTSSMVYMGKTAA